MASLSRARILYGASLGTPGSDTFTAVAEVTSISGFDGQNGEIEVTHLLSDGKEYIADLPDFGSLTCSILRDYTSANQNAVEALFISGESRNWQVEFLDRSNTVLRTADFQGYVSTFSGSEEQSAARSGEFAVRVSGAPVFS